MIPGADIFREGGDQAVVSDARIPAAVGPRVHSKGGQVTFRAKVDDLRHRPSLPDNRGRVLGETVPGPQNLDGDVIISQLPLNVLPGVLHVRELRPFLFVCLEEQVVLIPGTHRTLLTKHAVVLLGKVVIVYLSDIFRSFEEQVVQNRFGIECRIIKHVLICPLGKDSQDGVCP